MPTPWKPYDPRQADVIADLKALVVITLVFITCLGATIAFLIRMIFGAPGTWLDDTFGPPSLGLLGMSILVGSTVLLGFMRRYLYNRLRHDPTCGKEPRFRA